MGWCMGPVVLNPKLAMRGYLDPSILVGQVRKVVLNSRVPLYVCGILSIKKNSGDFVIILINSLNGTNAMVSFALLHK